MSFELKCSRVIDGGKWVTFARGAIKRGKAKKLAMRNQGKEYVRKYYSEISYKLINKFLKSRVGRKWDEVKAEFLNLASKYDQGFNPENLIDYYVKLEGEAHRSQASFQVIDGILH